MEMKREWILVIEVFKTLNNLTDFLNLKIGYTKKKRCIWLEI